MNLVVYDEVGTKFSTWLAGTAYLAIGTSELLNLIWHGDY
eukprot:SAG11_NODE_85_length_17370_cov_29.272017_6_plen_40_part_00